MTAGGIFVALLIDPALENAKPAVLPGEPIGFGPNIVREQVDDAAWAAQVAAAPWA